MVKEKTMHFHQKMLKLISSAPIAIFQFWLCKKGHCSSVQWFFHQKHCQRMRIFCSFNCTVFKNHIRWTNSRVSKKCCIWRTQQVFVKHVQSITKNPIDDDDVIDEKIVGRTGGSLFSTPQNAIIKQVISAIKNDTFLGRSHHSLQHLHFSQIFIKTVYF